MKTSIDQLSCSTLRRDRALLGIGHRWPGASERVALGIMSTSTFQSEFDAWLDVALSQPAAPSVVAFCFNLAEPWCIEIVGSDRYSADDPDWPCEESFRPDVEQLTLPESELGETWEVVLGAAKLLVTAYLNRPSAGSAILRRAEAVAVGFVDGELHRVWPR